MLIRVGVSFRILLLIIYMLITSEGEERANSSTIDYIGRTMACHTMVVTAPAYHLLILKCFSLDC